MLAGPAWPDDPPARVPPDGTEVFRGLLNYAGVRPIDESQFEGRDAGGVILVVHGVRKSPQTRAFSLISQDVLNGNGAVLLAAEDAVNLAPFFPEPAAVSVTGQKVYCPKPDRCYGGNPWCPLALGPFPLGPALPGLTADRVATNVASVVRRRGESRYLGVPVGNFSTSCRLGGADGRRLDDDDGFAFASDDGQPFRCLTVGDPSVFSNEMLLAGRPADGGPGPQNLAFALQVVEWLKAGRAGPRTRCLFVENGVVRRRFDDVKFAERPAPPDLPVPPLPSPLDPRVQAGLANAADKALARLEDDGRLERAIAGSRDDTGRFEMILRGLAAAAAAGGVLWMLARVWAGRHAADLPRLPPGRHPDDPPEGSLTHRGLELARLGQYTEPVRSAVRELFAAAGLPPAAAADPLPPVEATGRGAGELARQVRALWRATLAPGAGPIDRARWKELKPMFDAVRRAADAGRWRFAPGGGAA